MNKIEHSKPYHTLVYWSTDLHELYSTNDQIYLIRVYQLTDLPNYRLPNIWSIELQSTDWLIHQTIVYQTIIWSTKL